MISDLRMVSAWLQVELTAFKGLTFSFLAPVWVASSSSVAPFSYYTSANHFPFCHGTLWTSRWVVSQGSVHKTFLRSQCHFAFPVLDEDEILQQSANGRAAKLRWDITNQPQPMFVIFKGQAPTDLVETRIPLSPFSRSSFSCLKKPENKTMSFWETMSHFRAFRDSHNF